MLAQPLALVKSKKGDIADLFFVQGFAYHCPFSIRNELFQIKRSAFGCRLFFSHVLFLS